MVNKNLVLILCFLGSAVFAQTGPTIGYTAAPGLDLDKSWLDPGELVEILRYDAKTRAYEVSKEADPTVVRIYTDAENLVAAVPYLSLPVLNENPAAIVGRDFELEHELILLEPNELKARKANSNQRLPAK